MQGKAECLSTFSSIDFNQLFHHLQLNPRLENAELFELKRFNESSIYMINERLHFGLLFTYHEQILLCRRRPKNLYSTAVLQQLLQEFLVTQQFSSFPMAKKYSGKRTEQPPS